MEEKFLDKYRIDSSRVPEHDYNFGVYFITICTYQREIRSETLQV